MSLRDSSTPIIEKFPRRTTNVLKIEKPKVLGPKIQEGFRLPSMKPMINFKNNNNAKYFQNQNPALASILKKIGVIGVS